MTRRQRLQFSSILRHFSGYTLSHGPHSKGTDKRDKNTVPRATTLLELTQFPGFHIIFPQMSTHSCPYICFSLYAPYMCSSFFLTALPHLLTSKQSSRMSWLWLTPIMALLTSKVPPGEANPQHSCSPKEINKWIPSTSCWPLIREITQCGNTWKEEPRAELFTC